MVVGLDPRLENLPPFLLRSCYAAYGRSTRAASEALWLFNRTIIDAVHDLVPAVKPQLACYERYGLEGLRAYSRTVQYAREAGLLVIADAKRNDIGPIASLYASAFLGLSAACEPEERGDFVADAVTVNAYLGRDGIEPFVDGAQQSGTGVFVLVKTSNPSSAELQDLCLDGRPLYEHMGALVETWGQELRGAYGYSAIGAVVGATYPEQGRRLRTLMPHTPFLLPGYGSQGATASDVVGSFDAHGRGALVNASRSIIFAYRRPPYDTCYGAAGYGVAARAATQQMRADLRLAFLAR